MRPWYRERWPWLLILGPAIVLLAVRLRLAPQADGRYGAELPPMPAGRWRAVIEDARGTWRIVREAS